MVALTVSITMILLSGMVLAATTEVRGDPFPTPPLSPHDLMRIDGEMGPASLISYDQGDLRIDVPWASALAAMLFLLLLLVHSLRGRFYVVVKDAMIGKVFDLKGRPMVGASVKLEESGRKAVTNAEGEFGFDVSPRVYGMTVEKNGRKSDVFLVSAAPGQTYTTKLNRLRRNS